ncbi:MAG: von Willebrand factor type A domain-containing protein [Myxococcaceae bacterium]|nr:von Willebrand factor type A domain-containing protein [Myxococcaceae bacterium]
MGGLGLRGVGTGGGAMGGVGTRGRAAGPMDVQSRGEGYTNYGVNAWQKTGADRLSTFSVDVDTASYTLARAKLKSGVLPPSDSVRVEEFLNYFRWSYPQPSPDDGPLTVHMDAAPSPFSEGRHLLRVGVQGRRLDVAARKTAHLTFLVDVSGSMQSADKLPLAKRALRMLVDQLRDGDTVALVTYAGGTRVVLGPTGMEKKADIHQAIEDLRAGGSTAMADGIQLAYAQAEKTLSSGSESRVIIVSDGDANVGPRNPGQILSLIAGKVKEGITCTTLGFGMGNYQDTTMEQFANKGNGNHYYVDSLFEARRIFQEQLGGTLEVIAKDVKLQVDFNPDFVASYRLVGYENRDIADVDFRNDKVDAGEIGAGHTVTALYEVELKPGASSKLATVRLRAKQPKGADATEKAFTFHAADLYPSFDKAPRDLRFAAAVMGAAEIFRQSPHAKAWSYDLVIELANSAAGNAERDEFVQLLRQARSIVSTVAVR